MSPDVRGLASLTVWFLFLVLFPFYTGSSGRPQPAHLLAVALMFALALAPGLTLAPQFRRAVRPLFWFVWYVIIVNCAWLVLLRDPSIARYSLFYLYNTALFTMAIVLYSQHRERILKVTLHGVAVSVALQVVLSFFDETGGTREALGFNNPNQLGYYSIVCGVLFSIGAIHFRLPWWYLLTVLVGTSYLSLLSLSKGALLGSALLWIFVATKRPTTLVLSCAALVFLVVQFQPGDEILNRLALRVADHQADSWAMRGYDRIVNHPKYLVLGAGEGGYRRFDTLLAAHEMHSSIGTLLFSYGFIGTMLFGAFLWRCYRFAGIRTALLSLPLAIYGLGHQGLRFSVFWVLIAFVCCIGHRRAAAGTGGRPGRSLPGGSRPLRSTSALPS